MPVYKNTVIFVIVGISLFNLDKLLKKTYYQKNGLLNNFVISSHKMERISVYFKNLVLKEVNNFKKELG